MMARRTILGAGLMAIGSLFVAACTKYPKYVYRFKMTVEVDTPSGLKTGSSVYEVTAEKHVKLLPDANSRSRDVRGEAVAVDMPGGRTLFALLKTINQSGDDDLAYLSMATIDPAYQNDWVESADRIVRGKGIQSPAVVAPENYPLLVTFGDVADPTSVVRVGPDDLAASFGAGYRLKAITVQVTDEPVTVGIQKRLAWLTDKNRKRFDPNNKPEGIPLGNYRGLFSTEISR